MPDPLPADQAASTNLSADAPENDAPGQTEASPAAPPPTKPPSVRKKRRDTFAARRRKYIEGKRVLMDALVSGRSYADIADMMDLDVTTIRRKLREEFAENPPFAPKDHAAVQIMRLERAVRAFDGALERGDWRAATAFSKVVQMLDRYHGLAGAAAQADAHMRRLGGPNPGVALPAPAKQLAAPPAEGAQRVQRSDGDARDAVKPRRDGDAIQ